MVGTAIVFFPAAPLLLFIHGKDITIPQGTEITAFVSGDNKLDMAKFAPAGTTPEVTSGAASGASQMASLAVDSSVPGADIEIDGSFVGSTPSTLTVTPGQHTVVVKKKGYEDWTRQMNVSGNAVHLSTDFSAQAAFKKASRRRCGRYAVSERKSRASRDRAFHSSRKSRMKKTRL